MGACLGDDSVLGRVPGEAERETLSSGSHTQTHVYTQGKDKCSRP